MRINPAPFLLAPCAGRRLAAGIVAVLLIGLAAGCAPDTPTPEPATAEPPVGGPTAAVAEGTPLAVATPDAAEDLPDVTAARLLVAGSSLDNPPFSYLNNLYQPDGFDIALAAAIGNKLGVPTTTRDLAFDGLGGALEIGQVDLAIAAITVTPERAAKVDFSTPYFQSQSGLLAQAGATIGPIDAPGDLAPYRIGVQQGTVYEDWINQTLVKPGTLPAENLYTYPQPGDAVRDLAGNSLDLVMLDALPAQSFVDQDGVKLVHQGLLVQDYAIAVRKGSSLLDPINRALADLVADGTLADLSRRYLELDQAQLDASATAMAAVQLTAAAPPTATATPTPTATPPATAEPTVPPTPEPCVDGLALIKDLSYDDQDMQAPPVLAPGEAFTKGWRVQNIGTCAWTTTYQVVYVQGNTAASRMGGESESLAYTVQPGQTYDLDIDLVAPAAPGTYIGTWQMINTGGVGFGERLLVGIEVEASTAAPAATATTPPTATVTPGISFTADPSVVGAGGLVNFTWNAPDAAAVYFYAEGQAWQNSPVANPGNATVAVYQSTVFKLRVVQPDGSVTTQSLVVRVP